MRKITDYGKSMYGGWYANYYDEENRTYTGCHAETLSELCSKLGAEVNELIAFNRVDN